MGGVGRGELRATVVGTALMAAAASLAGAVDAQEIDGLLEAVEYYHDNATSDLGHIQEATRRLEAIAISSPPDTSDPDSWLPAYWTSFVYTQLALFAGDERGGPFIELSRFYYTSALTAKPEGDPTLDADFLALEGMVLSFEGRSDETLLGASRAAWERARAADPDNPMMLMNGGLALIRREETRELAYQLLDEAIEQYESRLGTVRPNWGREFIDVWMGSYPRGGSTRSLDLLTGNGEEWTIVRDEGSRGDPARVEASEEGLSVRTGASSVLHRSDVQLNGSFRLEVTIEQFDPERRNEGYGLVVGMVSAETGWSYDYFLVRQDGMALVKRRMDEDTAVLRDWSAEPSARAWVDRAAGSASVFNTLVVDAGDERVRFELNGSRVFEAPREGMQLNGMLGLRVNHGLSIRVTDFRVDHRSDSKEASSQAAASPRPMASTSAMKRG